MKISVTAGLAKEGFWIEQAQKENQHRKPPHFHKHSQAPVQLLLFYISFYAGAI